jgi:RHS repeat-associated protein
MWGEPELISGSFDLDYKYTSHYHHQKSGLHLAPFRAYDAKTARWISRDPIEEMGGVNLYGYVDRNPMNLNDPFGLESANPMGCPKAFEDAFDKNLRSGAYSNNKLKELYLSYQKTLRHSAKNGKWRSVARMNHRMMAITSRLGGVGGLAALGITIPKADAQAMDMLTKSMLSIQKSKDCGEDIEQADVDDAVISVGVLFGGSAAATMSTRLSELQSGSE